MEPLPLVSLALRLGALGWALLARRRGGGPGPAATTLLALIVVEGALAVTSAPASTAARFGGLLMGAAALLAVAAHARARGAPTAAAPRERPRPDPGGGPLERSPLAGTLLARVLDEVPVLFDGFGAHGRIVAWNRECERVTGYTAQEVLASPEPLALLYPDAADRAAMQAAWREHHGTHYHWEWDLVDKEGHRRTVAWTNLADRLPLPGLSTWAVGIDVTRRRRAEDAARELRGELRQAHKLETVGQLSSGIAHDLNNLLTAIFGYTDLARLALEAPGPAASGEHPAAESLDSVEQAAKRAMELTKALLTFSRRTAVRKGPIAVVEVVREAARLLRRLLPASIELATELPETAFWVHGDASQLQQVVLNLAIHARDAMPEGGALRLGVAPVREPAADGADDAERGERVAVFVADTGGVVPQAAREQVLAPRGAGGARGGGSGLGLPALREIVLEHGGELTVDADERGARFTIALPVCPPAGAPGERAPAGAAEHPDAAAARVLLAGDDDYVRSLMDSGLRAAGLSVRQARSGSEALALFARRPDAIDLVVIDYDLPGKDGLACLAEMRATRAGLPAIVASGHPDVPLPHGAGPPTVLLRKPFQMSELVRLVRRTLAPAAPAGETAP